MRRTILVSTLVVLSLSPEARAKIMDFYSVRHKTLGAYHIAQGEVTSVTNDAIVIQVEKAWKGQLKTGSVTVGKSDFHFEQSQEFLELKKGDPVVCFVFCEVLPEDLKFEVKYRSPRRLLPVKETDKIKQETQRLLAELEWVEKLREMHKPKPAQQLSEPDKQ